MDKADKYNGRLTRPSLDKKKEIKVPPITGKDKYMVTGRGLSGPVFIYFSPDQLEAKRKKYSAKGQRLTGPVNGE